MLLVWKKDSTIIPGDICMDCVKNRAIDIYKCDRCCVVFRGPSRRWYTLCEECAIEENE